MADSESQQGDSPVDVALGLTLNALSICDSEKFLVAAAHLTAAANALEQLKSV